MPTLHYVNAGYYIRRQDCYQSHQRQFNTLQWKVYDRPMVSYGIKLCIHICYNATMKITNPDDFGDSPHVMY